MYSRRVGSDQRGSHSAVRYGVRKQTSDWRVLLLVIASLERLTCVFMGTVCHNTPRFAEVRRLDVPRL